MVAYGITGSVPAIICFANPQKTKVMFLKLFRRKIRKPFNLFNQYFVDVRALYVSQFDEIPCVTFIGRIDTEQALAFFQKRYGREVSQFLQHCYFDHDNQDLAFNSTILVLPKGRIVEVAVDYCQIMHSATDYTWVRGVMKQLAKYKLEDEQPKQQVIGFAKSQMAE